MSDSENLFSFHIMNDLIFFTNIKKLAFITESLVTDSVSFLHKTSMDMCTI